MRDRPIEPCALGLFCILSSVGISSCGDETVYVQVNVSGIPPATAQLVARPRMGGVSYGQEVFQVPPGSDTMTLGFKLPAGTLGTFDIQIEAVDAAQKPVLACDLAIAGSGSREIVSKRDNSVNVPLSAPYPKTFATRHIYASWSSAPNDVWIAGQGGYVARWNGCYWKPFSAPPTTESIVAIHGFDRHNVWLVGSNSVGNVFAMQCDEESCTGRSPSPTVPGIFTGIWGASPTEIWAVGQKRSGPQGLVMKWDGASWKEYSDGTGTGTGEFNTTAADTVGFSAIAGIDAGHVYAVGQSNQGCTPPTTSCRGNLIVYNDLNGTGTLKWRRPFSIAGKNLADISVVSPSNIWFGGGAENYVARWGGTVTQENRAPYDSRTVDAELAQVTGLPAGYGLTGLYVPSTSPETAYLALFATGKAGLFYRTQNTAAMPVALDASSDAIDKQLTGLLGRSASDIWLVGYEGFRAHYDGRSLTRYTDPL